MQKSRVLNLSLSSLILVMIMTQFANSSPLSATGQTGLEDQKNLQEILQSCTEYCERVKQLALKYICRERIIDIERFFDSVTHSTGVMREEKIFKVRGIKRRTYSYDYQLIMKDDSLVEQRILLEENGRRRQGKNADLSHLKYFSQNLIFGPVGFLSQYWQEYFTYSFIGEEVLNGELAVIIQAFPNSVREDNCSIGRIWINNESQILRVEWEPASIQNFEYEILASPLGEFIKTVVWRVDYSVEKKGIRFPGKQIIQEIFYRDSPGGVRQKAVKRETIFEYDDYKFFMVETDVKYRKTE